VCRTSCADLKALGTSYYEVEISNPLQLDKIYDSLLTDLSGGELQRVAIAAASPRKPTSIFWMSQRSLDVEQRSMVTKVLNRFAETTRRRPRCRPRHLHDRYVEPETRGFEGKPSVYGEAQGPFSMEDGMNRF